MLNSYSIRFYILYIILLFTTLLRAEQSFDQKYKHLQKSPGYELMAPLAIATTLEDIPAINHFMRQAPLEDLMEAQSILQTKADQLKQELNEKIPRDIREIVPKTIDQNKIRAQISKINQLKRNIDKRIRYFGT